MDRNNKGGVFLAKDVMTSRDAIQPKSLFKQQPSYVVECSTVRIILQAREKFLFSRRGEDSEPGF